MGRVKVNRAQVEPYVQGLPPAARQKIRDALRALGDDPRPESLDIKVLQTPLDGTRFFRVRLGVHRVVYSIRGNTVYVHRAFHRRDGYGWLERA